MNYTDVFGSDTLPPSGYGYAAVTLTSNTTFVWPYNNAGGTNTIAKIMGVSAATVGISLILPPATQVSTGEDILFRNVGLSSFSVKDNSGTVISTVVPGAAVYIYLTDNTTDGGTWGSVAYGVGTSEVDAATLVGYGIIAIGSTLNQAHPVVDEATGFTLDDTYRSKLVNYTGGTATLALTSATTLGDDFFSLIRNSGTGVLTLDPAGVETVDDQATLGLQPGESLLLFCSGAAWYSVGYGRSIVYNFTQLVLDVSAAGTFTLTSAQASNKLLTFIGNPASAVTVVVPNTVAVYYILSSISTAQTVTVKTAAGTGVGVGQSARVIAICDATNVYSAQSVTATSSISLIDGNSTSPALNFASTTNTGLYKFGGTGYGFTVAGTARYTDNGTTITAGIATLNATGLGISAAPSTKLTITGDNNGVTGSSTGLNTLRFVDSDTTTAVNQPIGAMEFYSSDAAPSAGIRAVFGAYAESATDSVSSFRWYSQPLGGGVLTERMRLDSSGNIGIGNASVAGYSIYSAKNITGAVNSYGILQAGQVQSDVTATYQGFSTSVSTASAAFTLGSLYHFSAAQGTIGAGSTVTNQYGFVVGSTLVGATGNNFGFYSAIPAGTGRWNFYAQGSANNYMAGALGFGATTLDGYAIRILKNQTGASTTFGIRQAGSVMPDSATEAYGILNEGVLTQACWTLPSYTHIAASLGTVAGGAILSGNYGVYVSSNLSGGTFNAGVYSILTAPTAGVQTSATITSISSSGTTATITTSAPHGYTDGQTVTIAATANVTALTNGCPCTLLTLGTTTSLPGATTSAVTFTDNGDLVNYTAHGMLNGDPIFFSAITSTTGISTNTLYFVANSSTNSFQVSATRGGAVLPLTTDGSGTIVKGVFTATGAGTGTATVTLNSQGSGKTVASSSGSTFTVSSVSASYAAVTLLTGTVTVSTRWNIYASGTAPNYFAGNTTLNAALNQTPTRSTVASGSTITLTTSTNHLLYDNASTAATLTITLPSALLTDGQVITISTRSAITTLTVNGGTIYGAPATLAAGGFASFIYSSGAAAWFRRG